MVKHLIIILITLALLVVAALIAVRDYFPKIVKKSVSVETLAPDVRDPAALCKSMLPQIQRANKNHTCIVYGSERVTSEIDATHKCVEGVGIGGCFVCSYECRWRLPRQLDTIHF